MGYGTPVDEQSRVSGGGGERAMKYGRRDVRCSGAVELVVFAGRGEEMGVPCSGGTGSYQSSPDLSCR